ncbi:pyrimidine dimer DNA glycosylase/endonuclease V [Agromyces subbeticus]|uniref:pyrimidine dimer DNA glycosylase/endonuclease V n=1 Tax=Agromyces subbeticus TaxID=293890 RepID=UPI0003B3CE42|nr:pyrimidine dimer DNA glycosylase/endonuclease V [Agromyces subbeticus]
MRIWSLHPRYLDRQGLTACWREALLAQAVLEGATRGYTRHPQLERFRELPDATGAIGDYLAGVAEEATARGYRFDASKVHRRSAAPIRIEVASGQLALEWSHLRAKLAARSPELAQQWTSLEVAEPHPLFDVVDGPVASWERAVAAPTQS